MTNNYKVKLLKLKDYKPCLQLAFDTFMRFEAPEYSDAGIQAFKDFVFSDKITEKYEAGNFHMWEIRQNKVLIGMIAIRDQSHICLLFVDGDFHRKGFGTILFNTALKFTKKNYNPDAITVNASPYGIPFYKSVGFVETDMEQLVDGIRFTPMKLTLK